jgi:hypothetical protein
MRYSMAMLVIMCDGMLGSAVKECRLAKNLIPMRFQSLAGGVATILNDVLRVLCREIDGCWAALA